MAPDTNHDGFSDLVVGGPGSMGSGIVPHAYYFAGGTAGIGPLTAMLNSPGASDIFGFSVASAGDFDGDGNDDLITSDGVQGPGGGRATIFRGPVTAATVPLVFTTGGASLPRGYGWDWYLSALADRAGWTIVCSRRSWSQHLGLNGANSRDLPRPLCGLYFVD